MKYAVFSDMHSNLEAYEAVLDDFRKRGKLKYFCVGDVIGYGADPKSCIEITKGLDPVIVAGNHDWAAAGLTALEYFNDYAKKAIIWTTSVLDEKEKGYLGSLRLTYADKELTLVHGTLMKPEAFQYIFDLYTAYNVMSIMTTRIGFVGHSHTPGIFILKGENIGYTSGPKIRLSGDKKYLVNVGSIGQPRDGDWRPSYCIWDKGAGTIEIKRVRYDVKKAQQKIRDAGLPEILAERLSEGR